MQQIRRGRKEEPQLTQKQISELLETEGARSLVEAAEERGYVEPTELEAFALEHELEEADVEQLTRELEAIGLEVGEPAAEEVAKAASRKAPDAERGRRLRRQPPALPGRRRSPQAPDRRRGGHAREGDRARRPASRSAA